MTKERLEELIRQGGTVYKHNGGEIQLINSKETRYNISDNGYLHIGCLANFKYHGSDRWIDVYIEPDKLYETKEQAEWYAKTYAERIERFEPPMWEEVYSNGGYCFKTVIDYKVLCFITTLKTVEVKFKEDKEFLFLRISNKEN